MLSEEALERLSERLVNRIEKLNEFMLRKIGKQIYDIGTLTPSQVREVLQSVKYGNNFNEIIDELSEITDKNVKDIYKIFEEVAKTNQEFSKQFYEYQNVSYIPFDENIALQKQVHSLAKITADEYINMSKTFAFAKINESGKKIFTSLSTTYQQAIDEAILNISQGRESYEMVIKKTMKELTDSGIRTVDYATGYSRRADSSIRLNIMEGIRTLSNELQKQFGEEFGANGIEVSHHINPAPDHEDTVDGKQFSIEDFNEINDKLDRPVSTLNCYHFTFSIVLGVDTPLYSKEELEADKKANKQGFELDGKHYTNYEGTQLQRQIETKIRQYKDRQIGAKSINDADEIYHCQEKIEQLSTKYNDLSKISGLPTKIDRLRVDGYKIKKQPINRFKDVTGEWIKKAKPGIGEVKDAKSIIIANYKYIVNKKINDKIYNKIIHKNNEVPVANWLKNTFGGDVKYLPEITEKDNVRCADYLYKNEFWDLKEITNEATSKTRTVDNALKKTNMQTGNIILDISGNQIGYETLKQQVEKIYSTSGREWIDKIIIIDNYQLLNIYERNKKRN